MRALIGLCLSFLLIHSNAFAEPNHSVRIQTTPPNNGAQRASETDAQGKENHKKPDVQSSDLTAHAHALFEAIQQDNATLAADLFFPREPFLILKDIADPGRYWDTLFRIYKNDIHELHQRYATSLHDAEFVSFVLGSTPTWVKPGEEANKIGYFRTFNAKLLFRNGPKEHAMEVKTIISWGGQWYITHLLPIKR